MTFSHEDLSSQQGGRQKNLILFDGVEHTQISPNSSNFAQSALNIIMIMIKFIKKNYNEFD